MNLYRLDENHNPVPCTLEEYGRQYMNGNEYTRRVGEDIISGIRISTVFLALDHRFYGDEGPPILFETMIFGGEHDQYQERYCTWNEAVEGHRHAVLLVMKSITKSN